jgi:hypothetical protein
MHFKDRRTDTTKFSGHVSSAVRKAHLRSCNILLARFAEIVERSVWGELRMARMSGRREGMESEF